MATESQTAGAEAPPPDRGPPEEAEPFGSEAPPPDHRPPQEAEPLGEAGRRRRPTVAIGIAVLATALVAAAAVNVARRGGDNHRAPADGAAPEAAGPRSSTSSTVAEVTPQRAFMLASHRLERAGSFAYAGTASARDVSHVRPSLWLAVDVTIEGEVDVSSGRLHEVAVASSGRATETVTDGPTVWGRTASSRDALTFASYQVIPELTGLASLEKGAALLPRWLAAATNGRDNGRDVLGRRTVVATLPATVLGEIVDGQPAVDGQIVLTLDGSGAPVRVELTTVPGGPPLHLALDISRMGEPTVIEPPG